MNIKRRIYHGEDLAILIPTKDRPEKMKNLLDSLVSQSEQCGRIVVVASGENIEDLVLSFSDKLPVEYFYSETGGQINQRNIAISKLDDKSPLVISFDDDIVLEQQALEEMVCFWNKCDIDTAGVSFNIVNNPPYKYSMFKAIFGMSSLQQGVVLPSGYNVTNAPVNEDIESQWLCGGATVWRQEILRKYNNKEVASRWAICEDVIYSYPIGKILPLYVCSSAKVRHEHVYDHTTKMKYRYYGRTVALWRLYFVESHAELSRTYFLWMMLGQIVFRSVSGVILLRLSAIQYAVGLAEGVIAGLLSILRGSNLLSLLNEDDGSKQK
ncbi:MAG: glycosyltransferase family 2 protein [Desulfotalea sp.]